MNRQYKVIWSKVKHCYIVVSELVKRNGKSSSVKSKSGQKIGVTLAVLALCFGLNGNSLAADMTEDQKAVYDAVVAEFNSRFSDLESRTDALVRETANIPTFNESDRGISIGEGAVATEVSNIAIGYKANAGTEYSSHIAIGSLSEALGGQSIAIGNGARANTGFTIAIGHNADVARDNGESSDSIGIGTNLVNRGMRTILIGGENGSQSEPVTSNFAVGIGYHAIPGDTGVAIGEWSSSGGWGNSIGAGANAKGEKSQAIGFQAYASHEGAVALGHKSFAMGDNAVAIGHQSYAVNKEEIVESYLSDEHIYPVDGVVSVGNPEYQLGDDYIGERHRRITNMAGGVDDYDAANVKQLKALKREIDDVDKKVTAGGSSTKYVSFNSSEEGNKANDGATGGNAMAVGPNAQATGDGSTAVGWNAEATGIGHSAAYGANAKALGEGSLAVGPAAEAYGKSGLAIGNGAISNTETLNESSIAIGDRTEVKSSGSIGMGIKSIASGKRSMAMGIQTQATGDYSIALGGYTSASGADSIALGHNAVAVADSSVAIGAKSVADRGYDTYGYTVDHAAFTSDAELLTYLGKIDEYNATVDQITANLKDYKEKDAAWRADRNNEELRVAAEQANAKLVASQQALLKLTAAYKSYFGAASVGTDFATRQITGVAAGSEDTDAVNVAQLKALNTKVDSNKIEYVSINSTYEENKANDGATATDTVAIGPKASATYEGAVAIGRNVTANGGVAIGQNSSSTSEHSVAIGLGSVAGDSLQADVAIGNVAKAAGYSVAIGNGASAYMDPETEDGSGLAVAIGSSAVVSGQGGVAVGQGSKAVFQSNAMGSLAKATARGAVAIGDTTESTGQGAVAIGNRAEADNIGGIAIGTYTKGLGYGTIGIGISAEATGNWSLAMGQSSVASAKMSTALGSYSTASGGASMALGYDSAASSGASTALGYKAAANVNNGVALGSYSVADRGSKVIGYNVDGLTFASDAEMAAYLGKAEAYQAANADFEAKLAVYNEKEAALNADPDNEQLKAEYAEAEAAAQASFEARNAIIGAYRSSLGAISVGSDVDTRQITNVAAGSEDTDAVNVAQLKGLKSLVDTKTENLEDNSKGYFHANMKEATDPTWNNYGLMSDTGGAGGYYSVAAGVEAQVSKDAEKAVAIGYRTKTKQKGGIAVGYDTVSDGERAVAIGQDAVAKGVDATALGFNAQALNAQSLALGNQAKATGAWSIAIAQDTEASGHLSLAASYGAKTAGLQSVGIGVLAATSSAAENSVAIGTMAQALGENTTAIGPTAKVQGSRSVGLGQGATTESTAYNGTAIGRNAYIGSIRDSGSGIGIPSDGITQGDDTAPEAGKEHMNSTALGFAAKAFGFQNLSVGAGAETYDTNTIAIGVNAVAKDHYATALGKQARATGKNSTAIGHWATSVGEDSVSIGTLSTIQGLDGQTAVNKSATLGAYSRAAIDNSVALGHESLAYVGDDVATKAYLTDEAFAKENGVVSVGNAEYTIGETTVEANRRRITNVAGGADDYDAVNVAQLQAVEAEGLNFKGDGDTVVHRDLGTELIISGGNTDSTTLTENNIGVVADKDSGSLSVKLSKNVNLADGSVTFVETAKDADGNVLIKGEDGKWYTDLTDAVYDADAQSYTKNGEVLTAIANPVVGTVKLTSTGLDNGNQRITNVAAGVQSTDAVNMSQLNDLNTKVDDNQIEYVSIKSSETDNKLNDGATGDNSIAIGPKTKVTAASAVAIGSQSEISNSNFGSAYGATSKVTGSEQGTAIGYGALVDNSLFGTALGTRANVTNSIQGTAVGQSANVSGSAYGTSLGTFSKVTNSDSGIAIGSMANVNNANYGMAVGINSSVTNQGGTALGYGTSVTEKSGVALGLGAMANRSAEVYGYSPDGVTFTDDASVAAYLGKTAEFEQAHQDYAEKVQIFQEKLAAYQQDPRNPEVIKAYMDAANAMTESFEKRTGIIAAYKSSYSAVSVGGSGATRQIINVAAGTEDSDAVNLAQLKTVEKIAKAHTELTLDGKSAKAGADGALGAYIGDNNLTMAVKDVNGQKVYDLKLKNEVVIGQPGKDGKDGTPGSIGLVGPQGPAGEDGQPGKNAYGEISVKNGVDGVDGKHGKDGITRIVYEDENGEERVVATLDDGLKFAGDTKDVTIAKKLNETLEVKGGISDTTQLSDNNIGVVAADDGLTVKLAKNINLNDGSVRVGGTTGEDGTATGGIYISNQNGVTTTKANTTEDGLFITGLSNTDWNPEANGIVESRAATEKQLKAVADSSAKVDAANLSDANVNSWKSKLGITDTLLGEAGAWKLTVNGIGERSIKKDSVINFVNGSKVQITQSGNDITVGLDAEFVKQVGDNTTNITNLDKRVTKVEGDVTNVKQDITKINKDITNINQDITNINTKIETIEGKAGVANVVGDTETGVKVEKVDPNDATKGVKVSLEEKITVGGITIDGTTPSEGETANRTITGLTNTTWDADKAVDHRAATEGQLKDLSKQIKEVGEIKDGVRTYASDDSGDNPLKRKNSDAMELRGGADSDNLSDNNIGVVTNKQKTGFDIKLSKDLKGLNSAEIGNVSISNNITVGTGDQKTVITDNSVTTGNTTINNDGLTIKNEDSSKNITIQTGNVNLGGNAIHNVGEATEANDAINKAQLDRTVTAIGAGMNEMSGRIGSLDRRVDRVGAGAAALAALHPLEYSPDAKWEVTAGLGNYRSTSAVALGAFYRPNYDTLFSIGASYGGGENMVNAGVTWRIGEGETKNYPSKQVMAQEIDTLKSALAQQNDKIESQSEQLEEQNKKIEQLMQAIEKLTK